MKKLKFVTKNQLYTYRYLFVMLMIAFLVPLFLAVSNLSIIADHIGVKDSSDSMKELEIYLDGDSSYHDGESGKIKTSYVSGEHNPVIGIYDPEDDNYMIKTQLQITKQPVKEIESIQSVSSDIQLLIVDADPFSEEEAGVLQTKVDKGMSILFTGIPEDVKDSSAKAKALMGIENIGGEKKWPGIRTSRDLLTGVMLEKPEYEISGRDTIADDNSKIYACALPEGYEEMKNEDLPSIIWRYCRGGNAGSVYVFNGDFMDTEMGYGILPVVISEINDNYLYPVINSYCITTTGYPYSDNEERSSWTKLYSRDKQGIQRDMLEAQVSRFSKVYEAKITSFSPDYEEFLNTEDTGLRYFTDSIIENQGLLANETDEGLHLISADDGVRVKPWTTDFLFWNEKTKELQLPICFDVTTDHITPEEFCIAGFGSSIGFFSMNLDYEEVLDYNGSKDIWNRYSRDLEVVLGTQQRDYGWMDRVTAKEAFARLMQLLNRKENINYGEDSIKISIEDFEDEAWFILRSNKTGITVDNGTIEEIGEECYLVTLDKAEAEISWEERN